MKNRRRIRDHVRPAVLVCAAAAALSTAPAGASSAQVVHGYVTAPSGEHRVGMIHVGACPLVDAIAAYAGGDRVDEVFAYDFTVDPTTHGQEFVIRPGQPARLAITFDTGETTSAASPFELRGRVPAGARRASVCLVTGGPTSFEYDAEMASSADGTAEKRPRHVAKSYVEPPHDPFLAAVALTAARVELRVVCGDEARPGVGGACIDLLDGDALLNVWMEDRAFRPVSGELRFADSGGRVLGPPHEFCNAASVDVPPGASTAIVALDSLYPSCGEVHGPATAGTLKADVR